MRTEPPRHIRDIAHLYLSRMRGRGGGLHLVVAGVSGDVVPAFHVANLALAAAARGITTRVRESSGLPVNAGCFLGLNPRCWNAVPDTATGPVAAFARVTFALGDGAEMDADPEDGIEIVHVPPWETGSEHAHAVDRALARAGPAIVLFLAERDAEPRPWQRNAHGGVASRVAFVTRAGHAAPGNGCAGTFTRWVRVLTDPLPVVVRDPGSRLARQYDEAISHLLAAGTSAATTDTPDARGTHHVVIPFEPR
jgi:hypothetical protein